MSDVGGLIGLFLGFSLLSLFEFLLNICSFLKGYIKGLKSKIKQISKNEKPVNGENLSEIITVQEYRLRDFESIEVRENDNVFILPGQVTSLTEIEDLNSY